jgi:hypothetical protein
MGAYLVNIDTTCAGVGCKSRAVVRVFNGSNASRGDFCRKCGNQKLRELKRAEAITDRATRRSS